LSDRPDAKRFIGILGIYAELLELRTLPAMARPTKSVAGANSPLKNLAATSATS
jgi:hypothetical protein